MNDNEFEQRAHANPWDNSPDFLDAARQNADYTSLLARLQANDDRLTQALAAPVPDGLATRLLEIPEQDWERASAYREAGTRTVIVSSVWQWQRWAPLAACLVLALAVLISFSPATARRALAHDVLAHIHAELGFLDSRDSLDREALNAHLETYGGELADSSDMNTLAAKGVMDCWVEKEKQSHFHMVMQGEKGSVTVIVMTGEPVPASFTLDDERFEGIVVPTPTGNLVVAGEKGEPVEAVSDMLAANIHW